MYCKQCGASIAGTEEICASCGHSVGEAKVSLRGLQPTIGVFDSGFGGLTVLKALLEVIPGASYLYFGDTARLPYGSKSAETVAKYAVEAAHFLERKGADMLVIACNTATALALPEIEQAAQVPVIGVVEPGAEAASAASKKRRVVVIGTEATISSHAYRKALEARGLQAAEKACPLLVPLVEEAWVDHPVTRQVVSIYLKEAFAGDYQSADVLVLGCTHYPLLKPVVRKLVPSEVCIVDSAESTARAVAKTIQGAVNTAPALKFFATDSAEKFKRLGTRFLGRPIPEVEHVDLKE
jgi:glutamate racemase